MATEILIDGVVGYDVTHKEIHAALKQCTDDVTLKINSPGGSVSEGVAIHNAIAAYRAAGHSVTAEVTGMAASMATYIAMAANTVHVTDNSMWMVHHPYTMAMGNYRDMQKSAALLHSLSDIIANAYARKNGDKLTVLNDMDNETWLYGNEILTAGYADVLTPVNENHLERAQALTLAQVSFTNMQTVLAQAAPFDLNAIAALVPPEKTMPQNTQAALVLDEQPNENAPATAVESPPEPVAPPTTQVNVEEMVAKAIAAERQRVTAIRARCEQANMPQLAAQLIDSNATIEQTNQAIVDAWIAQGGVEIKQSTSPTEPVDQLKLAITAYQSEHQVSEAQATAAVLKAQPELYKVY